MFSSTTATALYDADATKNQKVFMFTRDGESYAINPANSTYYQITDNGYAVIGYTKGTEQTKAISEVRDLLSSSSKDSFVNGCAFQSFSATYTANNGGYIANISGDTLGKDINDSNVTIKYTLYSPVRGVFYDQTKLLEWTINESNTTTVYGLTDAEVTEPAHVGVRKNNKVVVVQNGQITFFKRTNKNTDIKIGGMQKGGETEYPCTKILPTDNSYWNAYRTSYVASGKSGSTYDGSAYCLKYCIEYDYLYGTFSDINFSI